MVPNSEFYVIMKYAMFWRFIHNNSLKNIIKQELREVLDISWEVYALNLSLC